MPVSPLDFTGADTEKLQAAIDILPADGGTVIIPELTMFVEGIQVSGTSGDKSNVFLVGSGSSSRLVLPTGSNLNVLEVMSGAGHAIKNVRVTGSKGNGGTPVRGPTRGMWLPSVSYAVNDTAEVSASNTATGTVLASNLVYKCTAAHTSSPAFLTDKNTKWVLVSEPNFQAVDLSYRYRNGVYVDGAANVTISGSLIDACVYAGVNIGTGPVQAANAGPGASNVRVFGNTITGCENGIAGGKWTDCRITDNHFFDCDVYGVVTDVGSSNCLISGNTLVGKAGCLYAVFLYSCQKTIVSNNSIRGWLNGVVQDGGSFLNQVTSNTLNDISNIAVFSRAGNIGSISGNIIHAVASHGAQIMDTSQVSVCGNVVSACGGDGINLTTSSAVTVSGNTSRMNTGSGIRLAGCYDATLSANIALDNGADGITGDNSSRVVASSNRCFDSRSAGSKTQDYGVRTTGTSNSWRVVANDLSLNGTADYSLVGNANYTFGNDRYEAAQKVGKTVQASASNVVSTLVPIVDAGGSTRYLLARNTP